MNLTFATKKSQNQTTLSLSGELDSFNRRELAETLDALIAEESSLPITLDLNKLNFIDSNGLGLLAISSKKLKEKNRQLQLVGTPPYIEKLLESSGLLDVLSDTLILLK